MATPDPSLTPLTLPSLPPTLAAVSHLKGQLASLRAQLEAYQAVEKKLDGLTDEPTWDAFIPFTPLAYFPGKLVHTNDITQTVLPAEPASSPSAAGADKTVDQAAPQEPQRILRSAKQAREEAARLQSDLTTRIAALERDIEEKEKELKAERAKEAQGQQVMTGDAGDEDWTVNERGELINEEGLPMFDIREDLPIEEPSSAASRKGKAQEDEKPKPKMRYLIKKGGKQVVPSKPSSATPSPAPPASATTIVGDASSSPGRLSTADIAALLDELELEEAAERAAEEARLAAEAAAQPAAEAKVEEKAIEKVEEKVQEKKDDKPAQKPFAGFSAGFLAKSKQKRPSNTLVPAPTKSAHVPTSPSTTASPAAAPTTVANPTAAPTPKPLKPALSRPSSPAPRSIFDKPPSPKPKKSVVWDESVTGGDGTAAKKEKKAPILLGSGRGEENEQVEELTSPGVKAAADGKLTPSPVRAKPTVTERPIKDQVVERPMKAPVPPGGKKGGAPKVSRFRKAKEEMLASSPPAASESQPPLTREEKGKGRAVEPAQPAPAPAVEQGKEAGEGPLQHGPIHTISLSSRPSPSSSSSAPAAQPGTISYADIPFDAGEDEPYSGSDRGEDDEDGEDWSYSDDSDDEEFDVDAALHAREVALEYHRQRLRVGAGKGTGALGGMHGEGESWFQGVEGAEEGLVPADATLSSLSSNPSASFGTYAGAGDAQLGRPSRFRQSTRHLESAQLIIPSLLAADPTLTTSHTPLGPALTGEDGEEGLDAEGQERLRRTLEALAEGKSLPEDEQQREREREIQLREGYAKELQERKARDMERRRTAGKAPPELVSVIPAKERTPVTFAPQDPSSAPSGSASTQPQQEQKEQQFEEPLLKEGMSQEEELAALLAPPVPVVQEEPKVEDRKAEEGEKPKKMSRFRQKQLGLIE
ncbi:uri1, prefoldin-like chaperone [Rhodosporidiobolus nylandii]